MVTFSYSQDSVVLSTVHTHSRGQKAKLFFKYQPDFTDGEMAEQRSLSCIESLC